MTNEDREFLANTIKEAVAPTVGELTVALLAVVQTLKNQPGFDRAAFDQEIKDRFSGDEEDSFAKHILSNVLDKEVLENSPGEGSLD